MSTGQLLTTWRSRDDFSAATQVGLLHQSINQLRSELAELREQSAREHAAWEAFTSGPVRSLVRTSKNPPRFTASSPKTYVAFVNDPVDAVLAVIEAEQQDE
uniref:Uncharacterized protein n=1 Tax=viral metagenome TaxID=1070528 RepID=A0A6M3LGJ0_9ZZZZ